MSRLRLRWPTFIELEVVGIGSLMLLGLASGLRSVVSAVASWF
ncbi:hypothetical protein [Sphingomonas sp. PAMC26645]|jgi:hypothetical protein|nr:hypothetical protein [Sphingomonas sp. PAMC26645]